MRCRRRPRDRWLATPWWCDPDGRREPRSRLPPGFQWSGKSLRNRGMGDFTDLASLIELADHLGADGVGLNPLHALFDDRPGDCSPYSPNSRLFLNALYIDVEKIPEFQPDSKTREALAPLRAGNVVDYVSVAGLKWRALRRAFAAFKTEAKPARQLDFDKFRAERGRLLSHFACLEVLP